MIFFQMKQIAFLLILSAPVLSLCQKQKTEVVLCATIHGAHKINPNYQYKNIYSLIDSYNPDIIGVEIRCEDIDSSTLYLKNNYPFEMYDCINKYKTKKRIYGFDWLGEDIEDKSIPENYWKDISALKKLERKLQSDSLTMNKLSELDSIDLIRREIFLNSSIQEINNGSYDSISAVFYSRFYKLLEGSQYAGISESYEKRDEKIAQNIVKIIKDNSGKKLIFLMGADHRRYSIKRIKQEFGDAVILNNVFK